MKNDQHGDRMKAYERVFTEAHIPSDAILCVRLDGKGFSKFTKGFNKPFDDRMTDTMCETTKRMVEATHATIGYVQSDEITLIFVPKTSVHQHMFGGKVSKINSVFASMTSVFFNQELAKVYQTDKLAFFDCRSWTVPSITEAFNVLLWRAKDARKNSTSALFRWTAGAKKMHGLDQAQMKQYLLNYHGVDWNLLKTSYKYGSYFKPVTITNSLTDEEKLTIPSHVSIPETVTRTKIMQLDVEYIGDLPIEKKLSLLS